MRVGDGAKVAGVRVQILGDRDYPLAIVKLMEAYVSDLDALVAYAQKLHPTATVDDVVKGVWRHGMQTFRRSLTSNRVNAFKYIPMPERKHAAGG